MGGYIAIKLLELCTIDTLILMCPALYDQRAYSVPFGKGFTDILRTPESWRNTDALKILEKFTGKLMVIVGDKDEVIPPAIITLIMHHSPMAQKKELYVIPNCPHKINTWLAEHQEELLNMHNKIEQFIVK
jgi:pimeloyl-ACP methyl ester carboxylesterase